LNIAVGGVKAVIQGNRRIHTEADHAVLALRPADDRR
jgi:hypothetical protein